MKDFDAQLREIFDDVELTETHEPIPMEAWATAQQPGYVMLAFRSGTTASALYFPAEIAPKLAQGLVESSIQAAARSEEKE